MLGKGGINILSFGVYLNTEIILWTKGKSVMMKSVLMSKASSQSFSNVLLPPPHLKQHIPMVSIWVTFQLEHNFYNKEKSPRPQVFILK